MELTGVRGGRQTRNFGGRVWEPGTEHSYQEGLRWAHCKDSHFLGGQSPGKLPVKPNPERAGGGAEHQVCLQGCSTLGHKTCRRSPCIAQNALCPSESLAGGL